MNGDVIDKSTRIKILFFAKARELSGLKESELTVPVVISFTELKAQVIKVFNLETIRDIVLLTVNEEFVEPNASLYLTEKDEIAVIPPLSGGIFFQDSPCVPCPMFHVLLGYSFQILVIFIATAL
jgi:molybdopterin converting factor subunit 1